jgi:hypothetical protein
MRTLWVLAGVVLAVAGCGTEEEAVDRDASAAETDEVIEPPGGCDTAVERLRAYVDANSSCETAADCATYAVRFSCDCGYQEAVRADSVAGAQSLLQEVTDCGIEPEDIFQCEADGAPPVVLACSLGSCEAFQDGSCIHSDWDAELPDSSDTEDTSEDPDVMADDCTTVEARLTAWVESNNQCETADDCRVHVLQQDCGCSYAPSVNSTAVDGATALQAEAERCGLTPEAIFGCTSDAAPGLVYECYRGRCSAYWPNSCLAPDDVRPDVPFEPDVGTVEDIAELDGEDGSGADAP